MSVAAETLVRGGRATVTYESGYVETVDVRPAGRHWDCALCGNWIGR